MIVRGRIAFRSLPQLFRDASNPRGLWGRTRRDGIPGCHHGGDAAGGNYTVLRSDLL